MNGRRYLHQPTLTDLPYSPSPHYRSTTQGLVTPVLRTSWSSSTASPSKRHSYHQSRSRHSRSSSYTFVQNNDDDGEDNDNGDGDEEDELGRQYPTNRYSYSSPGQHQQRQQQYGYQDQNHTSGQQLSYQQDYSPSRRGTRRQQQQRTSLNPTSNHEKKTATKPPHSQRNKKRPPVEAATHQPYYGPPNDEMRIQRKPLAPIATMETNQKPRYLYKQQLQPDSAHMGHTAPVGWKVSGQYDHLVLRSPLSPTTPPSLYDSSSSSTTLSSSSDRHHHHHHHHHQQQQQQQQQRQQRTNGSSLTTNGLIYHRRTRSSSGTKHVIDYQQQQQQRQSTTPSIASSSVSGSVNGTKSSGRHAASSTTTTNSLSTRSRHSYDDPGQTKVPERPRRYSQGDCSSRHSVPLHSSPPQQPVARRVSTPKLRRICSAKPYINNNNSSSNNSNYDDDDLVMDAASLSITKKSSSSFVIESDRDDTDDNPLGMGQLSHQASSPTFWNPRSPKDVIPVKRTLSRRLRGLLLPQRSKLDTTVSKDHHRVADYQWSLTRPTTPVHDLSFDNDTILDDQENGVMDNPFYMISQSWDIVDQISLHFDEDDFTQMDAYATSVQQIGPTLTPQTLSQKFLARPYRQDLYRLRIMFIWILQNIAIIDQRSDDKASCTANGPTQQQPAHKVSFRQRFTARKGTTSSSSTTDQDDDFELPALDVMHGDGLLPEGGTEVDSFDDWLFSESAQQVLLHRRCSSSIGMANLFSEMATAAGFHETRVVYGYLRAPKDSIDTAQMDDNDDGTNNLTDDTNYTLIQNHAWCCVKVEGEYRFVDCWLASPFQPQNTGKMEPHWFLTKPTDMIYTHFPQDPNDQCLEPTISVSTFFALPYVWASFFSHHIKMIRYNPHAIHLIDDQVCHLTFRVDPNVVCFAYIEVDPSQTLRCLAQSRMVPDESGKSERIYKVKAVLPPGHDHGWLKIYAGVSSLSSSTTTTAGSMRQENISNGTSLLISRHSQSTTLPPIVASTPSSAAATELPPLAMCFRLTHRQQALVEDRNRPFEFVHLHPCHHEFYIREPQCYHLCPLQTYNFLIRGGDDAHHKLAIKSPSGKLYKLMYYPQEHTYDGSVKIAESGKWSLISLLHHAGGWYVVATWECRS